MSSRDKPKKEIRMAWATLRDSENAAGAGPWYADIEPNRQQMQRAVEFGNRYHGNGTHWIEERVK